jgi:hypothetical protein
MCENIFLSGWLFENPLSLVFGVQKKTISQIGTGLMVFLLVSSDAFHEEFARK